jgi:hypothetical protein
MKGKYLIAVVFGAVNLASWMPGRAEETYRTLDCNNIFIRLNNLGMCKTPEGYAVTWGVLPPTSPGILWDQGIWIVGKIAGTPVVSLAQWSSVYSPGPVIDGRPAMQAAPHDSGLYRVYKIAAGDGPSNPDYAEWPFEFGAPEDASGKPRLLGDQTLWTVYNALDSFSRPRQEWLSFSKPMHVEIRQAAFAKKGHASDRVDVYSNTIFFEWTLVNRGDAAVDSAYFGLWTDIDFAETQRNLPGIDTVCQTAYCWDDGRGDSSGRSGPSPAVGYTLLYGPSVPALGETAVFHGRRRPGYKNLPITAFHGIGDDGVPESLPLYPLLGPIRSLEQAWNAARGYDLWGYPYMDPRSVQVIDTSSTEGPPGESVVLGEPERFPFSGDPVNETGWIFPYEWNVGGGSGFVFFSGPFTLAPRDTQWVMAALVPALGETNRLSVQRLREHAWALRSQSYDSLITGRPDYPDDPELDPAYRETVRSFRLFPNFPNPFNAGTQIPFDIPTRAKVILRVYDIGGRLVEELLDRDLDPGRHSVRFLPKDLPSGLYFVRMRSAAVQLTGKMIHLK